MVPVVDQAAEQIADARRRLLDSGPRKPSELSKRTAHPTTAA